MRNHRLSVKGLTLTFAVMWGGAALFVGLMNFYQPDYGVVFLKFLSSLYPGYHANGEFMSVLIGTGYSLLDGAAGGALFALLYNHFSGAEEEA